MMTRLSAFDIPFRQIFNERSLYECDKDRDFASTMKSFLTLHQKMHDAGFSSELAISRSIHDCFRSDFAHFHHWLWSRQTENEISLEQKRYLQTIFTHGAYLEELLDESSLQEDVYLNNGEKLSREGIVPGLVASCVLALHSVAIRSEPGYEDGCYQLWIDSLEQIDDTVQVHRREGRAYSISRIEQIAAVVEDVRLKTIKVLQRSPDRYAKVCELFPRLEFSVTARDQICSRAFVDNSDWFVWYCSVLYELDCAWKKVQEGQVDLFSVALSGRVDFVPTESETTKAAYSRERTFSRFTGEEYQCFPHIRNVRLNRRVHLYIPSDRNDRLFVGYIGKHLPTQNY